MLRSFSIPLRSALCVLLAVMFARSGFAADMAYKRILVEPAEGAVEARLPLTDVSGPARVKRMESSGVGVPLAPTKTRLDDSCYLEWQISYDSPNPAHWSGVPAIQFQRDGRTKYGCELSKLIAESRRLGFLSDEQIRDVRRELETLRESTLEEREKMIVTPEAGGVGGALPAGFARFVQRVPVLQKSAASGRIEIQLKQKQRAVGYQAMVYACIPLAQWHGAGGTLRGPGAARTKETVLIRFDAENAGYLLDVVRAFGIASREHNADLAKILDALLAQ